MPGKLGPRAWDTPGVAVGAGADGTVDRLEMEAKENWMNTFLLSPFIPLD